MPRGRPATPLGTYGEINVKQLEPKLYEADTRLRHYDGRITRVRARGASKTAATNNLKQRCSDILGVRDTNGLSSTSTISTLMDAWLESKSDVRPQTLERYKNAVETHIKPGFGNLRLNEIGPAFLDAWAKSLSPGIAGNVRTVLSGAFRMAYRYELVKSNPVTAVSFPAPKPDGARALSGSEIQAFRDHIKLSGNQTLIDVVDFCLCTGLRVGEALAVRWQDISQDDDGNYLLKVSGTVVYSKETGNHRQDVGKTVSSHRPVPLSARAAEIVESRRSELGEHLEMIFPSSTGSYIWENNFNRLLRKHRGKQWEWVTIHTLRKTVASLVADELDPHKAADLLGHADSRLTERVYYERNRSGVPIGDIIDRVITVQ